MNITDYFTSGLFLLSVLLGSFLLIPGCAKEETKTSNSITDKISVSDLWARPASENRNSAAYLLISNNTATPDTLLNLSADLFREASLHESYTTEEGLSGMRPLEELVIEPQTRIRLEPGGMHFMLMNARRTLTPGDSIEVVLHFSQYGPKKVIIPIKQEP